MLPRITIVKLESDDVMCGVWHGVYIDGALDHQDYTLDAWDLVGMGAKFTRMLMSTEGEAWMDESDDGFPTLLSDIPSEYIEEV